MEALSSSCCPGRVADRLHTLKCEKVGGTPTDCPGTEVEMHAGPYLSSQLADMWCDRARKDTCRKPLSSPSTGKHTEDGDHTLPVKYS